MVNRLRLGLCISASDVRQISLIRQYMQYILQKQQFNGLINYELLASIIEIFESSLEKQEVSPEIATFLQQCTSDSNFYKSIVNLSRKDAQLSVLFVIYYKLHPQIMSQMNNLMNNSMNLISFAKKCFGNNVVSPTAFFLTKIYKHIKLTKQTDQDLDLNKST